MSKVKQSAYFFVSNDSKGQVGRGFVAIPKGHPYHGTSAGALRYCLSSSESKLTYSDYAKRFSGSIMKKRKLQDSDWVIGFVMRNDDPDKDLYERGEKELKWFVDTLEKASVEPDHESLFEGYLDTIPVSQMLPA